MSTRRPARSAAPNQSESNHGRVPLTGSGACASPANGKVDASLIALARILARQAAALFRRHGAFLETSSAQGKDKQ